MQPQSTLTGKLAASLGALFATLLIVTAAAAPAVSVIA